MGGSNLCLGKFAQILWGAGPEGRAGGGGGAPVTPGLAAHEALAVLDLSASGVPGCRFPVLVVSPVLRFLSHLASLFPHFPGLWSE